MEHPRLPRGCCQRRPPQGFHRSPASCCSCLAIHRLTDLLLWVFAACRRSGQKTLRCLRPDVKENM